MAILADGATVEVSGSGTNRYTLERKGDVFSCSCPAWRNQSAPIAHRTCKHLRRYLGDDVETARVGDVPPARAPSGGPPRRPRPSSFSEDRDTRAARHKALERAVALHPVLDDRMQLVYGLRMPKHLAYAIGFWLGLKRRERSEAWAYLGTGPAGVGQWFLPRALERKVSEGLDERLQYRFRCDPPEMVTVFGGNSDGGHWGLWYDDPKELPITIVHNYARDSAETSACKRTLLATFRPRIASDQGEAYSPDEWPLRAAILSWLDDVLEREREAAEEEATRWLGQRPPIVGGMGPSVPGWEIPTELASYAGERARSDAYRARDPKVKEWIATASRELDEGTPGRALVIGRELHWVDADEWRAECTDLLVRAYRALGRDALAEIVRVHHQHRDLRSVDVYEPLESSPLVVAVANDDAAAVRDALAKGPAPTEEVADLFTDASLAVADVLLDALDVAGADALAIDLLIEARALPADDDNRDRLERIVARIFARHGARGVAFGRALAVAGPARDAAIAYVDVTWRNARGGTILHAACSVPSLEAVRALLDKGVDPHVKDEMGHTAYDAARDGWANDSKVGSAIFDLLKERGAGPESKVAPAAVAEWAPGVKVTHKTFGEGVVEGVTGTGDDTKLTVAFAAAKKTILARFVTRVAS